MTPQNASLPPAQPDLSQRPKADLTLVIGGVLVVFAIVATLLLWPDQSKALAGTLFTHSTRLFGSLVLVVGIASVLVAVFLVVSRFGDIRFGTAAPKYSTMSWLFMFITAGLGSATMYWAFIEWAYYYQTPGLNIAPQSREALDMAVAYEFFHWGPIPWAMYVLSGVSMAYYFHVRKGSRLSVSGNIAAITDDKVKADGLLGRIIDLLFLFATFGGLILTISLTVATVSAGLSSLFGIANTFGLKAVILIASTLLFGVSSYIGIDHGLQKLAKAAVVASFVFAAVVLVLGPTQFIIDNTTNAIGLELQNFFHMSLFTDPNGGGSFTSDWTVFYWLYWLSYLPGVGVFIARVSEGRTIRETVLGLVLGGCAGIMFFFGALSGYAIFQTTHGTVNAAALLADKGGDYAVAQLLQALPGGGFFSIVYFVIMLLFLASHLDATGFTIAAVSTRDLPAGKDPARGLRLFWVVMLAAIPMAMLAINANLGTLKTGLVLTAVPFTIILLVQTVGLLKWLSKDHPSSATDRP